MRPGGGGREKIQNTVETGGRVDTSNKVKDSYRSYVRRGNYLRLEHHHLMIRTHLTDWSPGLTTS